MSSTYILNERETGIKWIGKLPIHWKVNKIKYTTYVKGRIGWQGLRSDEFIEEGPYLVTGTNFIEGFVDWDNCYHITKERYQEAPEIHLKEGDLLITKDGTIGKLAIVNNKPEQASVNSGVFVTRPTNQSYITRFMYWLLSSKVFGEYIKYLSLGSTIKHLYQETFENFSFPCPDIEKQEQISKFLDKETSKIDQLIEKKQRLIELLQEKRQALITKAVTKGLNPNVPMKDSGVPWLGEVPEHWIIKKMSYLFENIGSGTTPKSNDYSYYDGEIPWINTGDLNDGLILDISKSVTQKALNEYSTLRVYPSKTLIIALYGATIGKLGILNFPATTNQACCAMSNAINCEPRFVFYWLLSKRDIIISMAVGGGQPNISQETIRNLKLACPNVYEQRKIIKFLDEKCSVINKLSSKLQTQITKLQEYRQALITAAVTGKIDVREKVIS